MKRTGIVLVSATLLTLLAVGLWALRTRIAVAPQSVADLPRLDLAGYHRLLVLAPHEDDETLGPAGLIMQAKAQGLAVRVVIETNGDGYMFATMEEFRRLFPSARDFIRMGNVRQEETLAALASLGLAPDDVAFLSYPDRGTPSLWLTRWDESRPYRSPYSEAERSPYARTYNTRSVYAGTDLLADLVSILRDFQPDLVIYPHPFDVHPDHWGLSAFTRLALALEHARNPSFQPDALAYLVHRPDYPEPTGLKLDGPLFPPTSLIEIGGPWLALDLDGQTTQRKWQAIQEYRSQLPLLRGLLERFARSNELFARVEPATLEVLASGEATDPSTWQSADGRPVTPVERDPMKDFITREALPAADLTALYAAATPEGKLRVCLQVDGIASAEVSYYVRALASGPAGIVHRVLKLSPAQTTPATPAVRGRSVCGQFDLSDLGRPERVFLGGDVHGTGVGILDQTAWQMVEVPSAQAGPTP
jgi:LmbE family N-acetylglucosaminyl deacetylase